MTSQTKHLLYTYTMCVLCMCTHSEHFPSLHNQHVQCATCVMHSHCHPVNTLHRLSDLICIQVPLQRQDQTFSVTAPEHWNNLLIHIRQAHSLPNVPVFYRLLTQRCVFTNVLVLIIACSVKCSADITYCTSNTDT